MYMIRLHAPCPYLYTRYSMQRLQYSLSYIIYLQYNISLYAYLLMTSSVKEMAVSPSMVICKHQHRHDRHHNK